MLVGANGAVFPGGMSEYSTVPRYLTLVPDHPPPVPFPPGVGDPPRDHLTQPLLPSVSNMRSCHPLLATDPQYVWI